MKVILSPSHDPLIGARDSSVCALPRPETQHILPLLVLGCRSSEMLEQGNGVRHVSLWNALPGGREEDRAGVGGV